jgi:hypothetical protein
MDEALNAETQRLRGVRGEIHSAASALSPRLCVQWPGFAGNAVAFYRNLFMDIQIWPQFPDLPHPVQCSFRISFLQRFKGFYLSQHL